MCGPKMAKWKSGGLKKDALLDGMQFSRLKSSMPFNSNSALQNVPLSKQPFKTQPQFENDGIT